MKRHLCALWLFALSSAIGQPSATIPTEAGVLHYREFGKGGIPAVIVGGLAGVASDYLIPLAQELGKRGRTILIDQRGTGGSRVSRVDTATLSAAGIVKDLELLRNALKIKRWVLVGHSWGGTVAMNYAGLRPNGIRGLLLIGPAGFDLRIFDYYNVNIMAGMTREDSVEFMRWSQVGPGDPQRNRAKVEQFRAMLGGYLVNRGSLSALRTAITDQTYTPSVAEAYWYSFMDRSPPLLDILPSFTAPSIIIQGEKDPVDRRTADRIRRGLKVATIELLPNCGGFPWLECPEQFWRAADRFLRKIPKER